MYGFYEEVERKHSRRMAGVFTEAFNWLPLAHLIDSRVLVVHGGLFSRDGVSLEEIGAIDRNRQPPREGNNTSVCTGSVSVVYMSMLITDCSFKCAYH